MSVVIRLMRFGKRGSPQYRIVAIDKRKKRDGSYLDKIGIYNPMRKPSLIEIDQVKYESWQKKGAQVSEGLRRILKQKTKHDNKVTK